MPYILEYNGSEISMRRSFEGTGLRVRGRLPRDGSAAFEQATLISVVSAEIRTGLVDKRGVDPAKILVNPNGVDLDAYAPAPPTSATQSGASSGFDARIASSASPARSAAGTASTCWRGDSPHLPELPRPGSC